MSGINEASSSGSRFDAATKKPHRGLLTRGERHVIALQKAVKQAERVKNNEAKAVEQANRKLETAHQELRAAQDAFEKGKAALEAGNE